MSYGQKVGHFATGEEKGGMDECKMMIIQRFSGRKLREFSLLFP